MAFIGQWPGMADIMQCIGQSPTTKSFPIAYTLDALNYLHVSENFVYKDQSLWTGGMAKQAQSPEFKLLYCQNKTKSKLQSKSVLHKSTLAHFVIVLCQDTLNFPTMLPP
jgi:hypothetical protein